MSVIIASQLEDGFNDGLRAHAAAPTVIGVPEERPWDAANDADILLVRPTPAWRGNRDRARPAGWPGRVKWIYSASAGVDFYPPWLLEAPIVSCGRGVASEEIADYVIAAIYAQAKNLEGVRARSLEQWTWAPLGRVSGSTLGIIGFGAIGEALARKALGVGLKVVANRRRPLPSAIEGVTLVTDPAEVVALADHLVLAVPATVETRHLVDAALLAHARPGVHVINVARGSVLDQDALIAALDAGRVGFATLDVTDPEPLPAAHPLWTHERVRLTPHVSSNHTTVRDLLFDKIAANLARFVRGETPGDIVDRVAGY